MGWFEENQIEIGGNTGIFGGAVMPERQIASDAASPQAAPAPAGGGDKQWLDWINATYGKSSSRGTGFADLPKGTSLEQAIGRFNQETGANAKYIGGPSGDRVDFGQGVTDALTAGGQLWSDYGAMSGQPRAGASAPAGPRPIGGRPITNMAGGYGGSGSSTSSSSGGGGPVTMPTAPTAQDLKAPDPFSYAPSNLGQFQAPSQTPTMDRIATPGTLTAQQVGTPATLNYTNLATPEGYQAEKYQGLSADQLAADPSYKFRFQQGQGAAENILAHSGALRTGNAAKALTDYGQQSASQEYAAADQRARATNAMNNATSLGQYQTNAQTGLAYNQNANQNAMNFGQANISNQLNATQANNAANLAYGGQNFQQGYQATQANNQNALAAQQQQFGQAATGYGLNQQAQQQGYNQALGQYGQNAQTQLAYGSQNQQNQLANYQSQVNAALGLGNLNLGFQNSANSYNLGQGSLGLQQQGQNFNQGLATYDRNYQANVTDPWSQQYQMANLGNPGAPQSQGNANQQSDLYTQQGNANAAGTVGAQNAWNQGLSTLGQQGLIAAEYVQNGRPAPAYGYGSRTPKPGEPGYGVLA